MNKEHEFTQGLNIISGPNAVGKTRLLENLKQEFSNIENTYFFDNFEPDIEAYRKILDLFAHYKKEHKPHYIFVVSNDPTIIAHADNHIQLTFDK